MSLFSNLDQMFMQEAIKQAQAAFDCNEVPVGAVIVHQKRIIAKAHNQVEMLKDPTAHAEMIALTQATNTLAAKWLNGCIMYVTIEPCSMCAGALVLSRVAKVVFGAKDEKAGACGTCLNIARHSRLNHRIAIVNGLLEERCAQLMGDFFKKKRAEKKMQSCFKDFSRESLN